MLEGLVVEFFGGLSVVAVWELIRYICNRIKNRCR